MNRIYAAQGNHRVFDRLGDRLIDLSRTSARVDGLDVRFTGGKMRLSAQSLTYGMLTVQDLLLVGRLVAQNGQLQMQVESVQPGGLIGAVIPSVVNQALAQYTAQYYVEEVNMLEGQLELRVR